MRSAYFFVSLYCIIIDKTMLIAQKLWYKLKTIDNKQLPVQNLNTTVIAGVTFHDDVLKRYLYLKFLNTRSDDQFTNIRTE